MILPAFGFMLLGGLGLASSFYVPATNKWTNDHCIGAGWAGSIWMLLCFILTLLMLR